jgi:cyclic pyranopterin phosphate synthase
VENINVSGEMKDRFNRKINYLRISVTDHCNLRCGYCMQDGESWFLNRKDILSFEEIETFCTVFAKAGLKKIKLTGGEPLVRKDIEVLAERLKKIPGIESVTLTTNGILLKEKLADLYKAGIDGINISLDTLDEEKYRRLTGTDGLRAVLEAIDACCMFGILTKINCVAMKDFNCGEIIEIAGLAKDLPLDVRFIEIMPFLEGKNYQVLTENEMLKELEKKYGKFTEVRKRRGNGPAKYYEREDFKGCIGFISPVSHEFCGECNRVRLSADGKLKFCLAHSANIDIKRILRSGAYEEEVLLGALRKGMKRKPERHDFYSAGKVHKDMWKIGG